MVMEKLVSRARSCDRERGKSANLGCVASLSQGPHSGKKVKPQLVVYQRVILTSDRSACHQQYRAHLPPIDGVDQRHRLRTEVASTVLPLVVLLGEDQSESDVGPIGLQ